ncbi:hypothetical protein [Streptomyces sp. NL15-2K]|uniref:hypothetical protein n=1 Tax=Streptomyces sp. NL15-2K TaxID=376149 RepID=UPI000F56CF8B|nr:MULTISPECIES: hypothetical protein [Actinomycetes]WKX11874.1 hypothetical protein Q4V64_31940 [Kutzneria buriramensis]GCB46638.1 hypothetical protein SNL152K_3936 [Streptomyces sp. NL15-2K]
MILQAALSGAALRVTRTGAGRRALQVALLVGGLFVLGLLCGERAQAADGVPAAPTESVRSLTGSATTAARPAAARAVKDVAAKPAVVTEHVVRSVDAHVVRPVGDLGQRVADGLTGIQAKVPPLPTLPEPTLPGSPSRPGLPIVPGLPELPGLPPPPVHTLPDPVTTAPQPGSAGSSGSAVTSAAGGPASDGSSAAEASRTYGPRFAAGAAESGVARTAVHRTAPAGPAPAHQAPTGDPGGALGAKSAVDHGTPRHGDAHAVTLDHRAPLRLVPGAAARVDADGTRDRHRDIPVFPG